MSTLITPRTLKGFRDYPPALMMPAANSSCNVPAKCTARMGLRPSTRPALEYAEILLGKGGDETDKQMYRFRHADHDVALRFDLTIPFARFAAQHIGDLGVPFKRYHMGPVWRGENAQRGRYREFWQCDFDTIGTTSNAADIETALVIHDLMRALDIPAFEIRVNNRMVLNGLLETLGLADRASALLRCLDKLGKIAADQVAAEMVEKAGVTVPQAGRVLALSQLKGSNADILDQLQRDFGDNACAAEGIKRLRELVDAVEQAGVPAGRVRLDLVHRAGIGLLHRHHLRNLPPGRFHGRERPTKTAGRVR
jgi:histidyl-tRNA synthetase